MRGIESTSTGSEYFRIKPYPVLVTRAVGSQKSGLLIEWELFTGFVPNGDGTYAVSLESKFGFNPHDVVMTAELQAMLDESGFHIQVFERETPVKVVRRKVEGDMAEEKSECPSFKKHWDPDVEECKDCKEFFAEEYSECRKACMEKQEAQGQSASSTPPKESSKGGQEFKGFRKGSRADVLLQFLAENKMVKFTEAVQHISETCDVGSGKATENAKAYLYEWVKGQWGGKDMNFPFVITMKDDVITYEEVAG